MVDKEVTREIRGKIDESIEKDEKWVDELSAEHKEMDEGNTCEMCGNYSESLKEVNGSLVCEECEETVV